MFAPCQRQRAAGTAFPRDRRDHGRAKREPPFGGARDGLALAALLGAHAGIGAGGIHEAQYRQAEPVGHVHQPHRLAVALRPRHAEVMLQAGFGVAPLLVAHHHHAPAAEAAQAPHHRLVVAEHTVAAQLHEVLDQLAQIVGEMRPVGVAGDLGLLPRIQPGIDVAPEARGAAPQRVDLALEGAGVGVGGEPGEIVQLGLDLGHGPLEVQVMTRGRRHARGGVRPQGRERRTLGVIACAFQRMPAPRAKRSRRANMESCGRVVLAQVFALA